MLLSVSREIAKLPSYDIAVTPDAGDQRG